MSLKVIGSGFGRTGTLSTKLALEQLGFGPCHQMVEVMGNPEQPAKWAAVAAGEDVDWEDVYEGYTAQVDFPGAAVWRQTTIAFPDAEAEILLLTMSEKGLCASGDSACSSGSISVSPVLTAMGLSERRAGGSVRFSLSKHTTDAEIDQAIRIVQECHERTCASAPASRG